MVTALHKVMTPMSLLRNINATDYATVGAKTLGNTERLELIEHQITISNSSHILCLYI